MARATHKPTRRGTRFISRPRGSRYRSPTDIGQISLSELLSRCGRPALEPRQFDLLHRGDAAENSDRDLTLYYAGDIGLLEHPSASIVGTREVSPAGVARAERLARELVTAGVVVVSGLAKGVDRVAHESAIASGGKTVAVIGTPLDKAYPAENAELQEQIYRQHLLISPFPIGQPVFKGNFPARNRVMAAVTDATVIVEASDTSGTLHQAAECQRLKRWLFIMRAVAEDPHLTWPRKFLDKDHVAVLSATPEIVHAIGAA